jgi:hypothetical protein
MADPQTVKVLGPDDRPIEVELLDVNHEGSPWEGIGYRAAIARRGRRRIRGHVHWLAGAWRFKEEARKGRRSRR